MPQSATNPHQSTQQYNTDELAKRICFVHFCDRPVEGAIVREDGVFTYCSVHLANWVKYLTLAVKMKHEVVHFRQSN